MKNKLAKTLASLTMVAALAFTGTAASGASLSAYAENDTDDLPFGGDYAIVDMDEYQRYLDTLTDEELQLIAEKERMAAEIERSIISGAQTASATPKEIKVPGVFTIYRQETNTYCGPACIKSVLMYLNGSSPSQKKIDEAIKMSFFKIPEYINTKQDKCNYVLGEKPSETQLESFIKMDIINFGVPTFLRLSGTTTSADDPSENWYYPTNGHCVLATSIFEDNSKIWIADPLGGVVPGCPGFYEKKPYLVAKYTTHICW